MSQIQQQQQVGQKRRVVCLDNTEEKQIHCGFDFHKVQKNDGSYDRSMYYIQALCLKENCPQTLNGNPGNCYDLCIRCLTQKHKSHDKIPLDRLEEFINKGLEEDDYELDKVKKTMKQRFGLMKEKVIEILNILENQLEEYFQEMGQTNNYGEFWTKINSYTGTRDRQFYNELGQFASQRIIYNKDQDTYGLKNEQKLQDQQAFKQAQAINEDLSNILKNVLKKLVERNKKSIENKKIAYEKNENNIFNKISEIRRKSQEISQKIDKEIQENANRENKIPINVDDKQQQVTKINQQIDSVFKFQEELNSQWEMMKESVNSILTQADDIIKEEDIKEIKGLQEATEDIVKQMIDNLNSSMITLEDADSIIDQ